MRNHLPDSSSKSRICGGGVSDYAFGKCMRALMRALMCAMYLRPPAYHKADDESFFFRENGKTVIAQVSSHRGNREDPSAWMLLPQKAVPQTWLEPPIDVTLEFSVFIPLHSTQFTVLNHDYSFAVSHKNYIAVSSSLSYMCELLYDITISSKKENFPFERLSSFTTHLIIQRKSSTYITNFRTKRSLLTRANETLQPVRAISSRGP